MLKSLSTRILICVFLFCFAGCATLAKWERRDVSPGFDTTFIKKIGVFQFANYSTRIGAGQMVADRIERMLLENSPYTVVSRMEIDALLREHRLGAEGVVSSEVAVRLGKLAGIDAIVIGSISQWDESSVRSPAFSPLGSVNTRNQVAVRFSLKVINAGTGCLVWSKECFGNRIMTTNGYGDKGRDINPCRQAALEAAFDAVWYLFPHRRLFKIQN